LPRSNDITLVEADGGKGTEIVRLNLDGSRAGISVPMIPSHWLVDLATKKRINLEHGHGTGDAALKHAAQVFGRTVRQGDVIARFGGEEFVVALHAITIDDAEYVAEKIRLALEQSPCVHEGLTLPLTASFGVAEYRAGDDTLEQLITRADAAMYQAKQAGKNRVVVAA
jgi:diguanylate cyclase (GGDEF)-like protein